MAMELTFGKVVTYIFSVLMLLVLVGGIVTFTTPLGSGLKAYVEKALNLGTQPVPFTATEEVNTATSSTNALLYAINKVAWYDTYKPSDAKGIEIRDMSKKFMDAQVIPLIEQREMILVGDYSKTSAMPELVRRVVDCKKIYDDRGKIDSQCFTLDFTGADYTISEGEFKSAAEDYIDNGCSDDDCKSILKDILGKKFLSWQINYKFSMQKDGVISKNDKVKICAEDKTGSFFIHITDADNIGDICKLPEGEYTYGMKVVNFELPQDVDVSPGLNNKNLVEFAKKYTNTYGDPEYILYYEVFPDGEDTYWKPSSYIVDFAQILTVEGIFLAIDMIPAVGKVVSKTIKKIPGVQELLEKFTKEVIQETGERAATEAGEQAAESTIKNSKNLFEQLKRLLKPGEIIQDLLSNWKNKIITNILGREVALENAEIVQERLMSKILTAIPEQNRDTVRKIISRDYKYIYQQYVETGLDIFTEEGKFTPGFVKALIGELDASYEKELIEITVEGEVIEKINRELYYSFTDELVDELSDKTLLQGAKKSPVRFFLQIADNTNERIPSLFKWAGNTPTKEESQKAMRDLFDDVNRLNNLEPYELRKLAANRKKAIAYALEMQDINPDFAKSILGNQFPSELATKDPLKWTKSERERVSKLLDERFDAALKDANPKAYALGKMQTLLFNGDYPKTRHLITAAVVYSNALEDSLSEKFVPVGTNAIGLRTPFLATTIYDDTLTASFDYGKNKEQYVDFFKYYAGYKEELGQGNVPETEENPIDEKYLGYRGLLPEVNRYYLSLVKDKGGINPQDNQRFHLASPCEADIVVTKTVCECWGNPKEDTVGDSNLPELIAPIFEHPGIYETGGYNEFYDQVIKNFDSTSKANGNKMLYTIGANGDLIKECYPRNFWEHITFWEDASYKPSCIEINPIIKDTEGYNYCYHGQATAGMIAADVGLNYVIPIGASLACVSAGPQAAAICGFIGGAGGGLVYSWLNTAHQWPNHN